MSGWIASVFLQCEFQPRVWPAGAMWSSVNQRVWKNLKVTDTITANDPKPGFYRYRAKRDGRWEPCAIWMREGELVCRVSDRMVDVMEIWTWVADKKVTKEAAKFAFTNGYWED